MAENKETKPTAEVDEVKALMAKMKAEGKKILTLSLKQKYFDAIMASRKRKEFREVTPLTYNHFIQHDKEGYDILDENGNMQPIHYDAILFYTGAYNAGPRRDHALVEVTGAIAQYLVDAEGKVIEYKVDDGVKEPFYWQMSQVVFDLGKILAVKTYPKDKVHYHG